MYDVGVMAVFLIFALLNLHAYGQRAALDLTPREVFATRSSLYANLVVAGIPVISLIFAVTHFGLSLGAPGWIYVVTAPAMIVFQRLRRRQWSQREALVHSTRIAQATSPDAKSE
jgi:hypothetical protein